MFTAVWPTLHCAAARGRKEARTRARTFAAISTLEEFPRTIGSVPREKVFRKKIDIEE